MRGHYTTDLVLWLFEHGIMPLYSPLGGSWLNMAESIQRILFQRGLAGQYPKKLSLLSKRLLELGTRPRHLLSGVPNELLVVSAVGNAGMPWVVPGRTLVAHCIENLPLFNNGNTHANRPSSSGNLWAKKHFHH